MFLSRYYRAKNHMANNLMIPFMVGMENVTQQFKEEIPYERVRFQDGIPNPATIVSA